MVLFNTTLLCYCYEYLREIDLFSNFHFSYSPFDVRYLFYPSHYAVKRCDIVYLNLFQERTMTLFHWISEVTTFYYRLIFFFCHWNDLLVTNGKNNNLLV
jgi:hypothetical protein